MKKVNAMRATATMGLAQHLLIFEAAESQEQASLIEAAEGVSDKLRAHLSQRIGQEGFRTLLARSLTLATAQYSYLSAVQVGADGSLIGLRVAASTRLQETQKTFTEQDIIAGAIALIAHLLALLITFIGDDLTLRLVSAVWPDLALEDATVGENKKS